MSVCNWCVGREGERSCYALRQRLSDDVIFKRFDWIRHQCSSALIGSTFPRHSWQAGFLLVGAPPTWRAEICCRAGRRGRKGPHGVEKYEMAASRPAEYYIILLLITNFTLNYKKWVVLHEKKSGFSQKWSKWAEINEFACIKGGTIWILGLLLKF